MFHELYSMKTHATLPPHRTNTLPCCSELQNSTWARTGRRRGPLSGTRLTAPGPDTLKTFTRSTYADCISWVSRLGTVRFISGISPKNWCEGWHVHCSVQFRAWCDFALPMQWSKLAKLADQNTCPTHHYQLGFSEIMHLAVFPR